MVATSRTWRALPVGGLRAQTIALPLAETALAVLVFAIALGVYSATLTPSLSYQSFDGNELATVPYVLGLAHSTGYPLYTWVGKLFTYLPIGDVAHRMNRLSADGAAGSAAFRYVMVLLVLNGDGQSEGRPVSRGLARFAAGFGALLFAFSTAIWSQAVIAEVYAPNMFMVGLTFVLLLLWARREEARPAAEEADGRSLAMFGLFALAYGLSIGTHMSNLALAPGFVLFIVLTNWRVLRQPSLIAMGAVGFGVGALQFAWLPYKASHINDAFMARIAPTSLEGIYNYTLNAFPQFKWAFPLEAVPDRVTLYIGLLLQNFRLIGAVLGLVGGWAMIFRHPRAFFLFVAAYLAEVVFFLEYRAFDIDVFFIPAHYILAVFIAYGAYCVTEAAAGFGRRFGRKGLVAPALAILVIGAQPLTSLGQNWSKNDQSANTGINDFYEAVFERLPPGSVLVGRGGVFGYDMFYFRYVYDARPDVTIPLAEGVRPSPVRSGGPVFTNVLPSSGAQGPAAPPSNLLPRDAWYWPLLAAPVTKDAVSLTNRQLVLYEVKETPPPLFVGDASPARVVDASFGNVSLVGYDIDSGEVTAGGTVHLRLYWRLGWPGRYFVSTRIGDTPYVETHELGFGNIDRYTRTLGAPPADALLVEEYDLVVLSSLAAGEQPFQVRLSSGAFAQDRNVWLDLGTVSVR